jgi:hypothetical protein
MPTSADPSAMTNEQKQQRPYKTYSNTTKWGQNEFPDLADAVLLTEQQNQQKSLQQQQTQQQQSQQVTEQAIAQNSSDQMSRSQYNNGPVLKPSSTK